MAKFNMIELDPVKLDAFLSDKNPRQISEDIGKNPQYISHIRTRLKMPVGTFRLLCRLYDLPEDALLPDPQAPCSHGDRGEPGPVGVPEHSSYTIDNLLSILSIVYNIGYDDCLSQLPRCDRNEAVLKKLDSLLLETLGMLTQ